MASLASGRPLSFEGFEAIVVGIQRVNLDNEPIFARVCLSNKKLTNYIEIINNCGGNIETPLFCDLETRANG